MSISYYEYGTCDICQKELDSRKEENLNNKSYDCFNLPTLSLYPSALPSWHAKQDFYTRTYCLCSDCIKKLAKLLYDSYGFYFEK